MNANRFTENPLGDMLRLLVGVNVSIYDAHGYEVGILSNFEHEFSVGRVSFELYEVNNIVLNSYGWSIHLNSID